MAGRIFDFDRDRRRKAWQGGAPRADGKAYPARRRRRGDGLPTGWIWGLVTALAVVALAQADLSMPAVWTAPQSQPAMPPSRLVGLAPATPRGALAARPMPACGGGRRVDCVVDGDTFWIEGEKVRIETIDAPEVNGRCAGESALAQRATRRLVQLLSNRPIELARTGTDRYGRTLARVRIPGGDVGAVLVREGLARPWQGRKATWCPAGPGA